MMLNYKLLILEILAVLAMNTAYADDSSIMELFNEKEASSIETTVEKLPSIPAKKASNINKSKLDLSVSLQNPVKNNKIKQRKTHYGIGYEYRKSIHEQVQKTDRVIRSEKTQRPERVERPEKISRPERIERPERINRPERIDRPDRPGRH